MYTPPNNVSRSEKILKRLRHIAGSRWVSPSGVRCIIEGLGIYIPDICTTVLYRDISLDQLDEIVRDNERYMEYSDDSIPTKTEIAEMKSELRRRYRLIGNGATSGTQIDSRYPPPIIEEVPF